MAKVNVIYDDLNASASEMQAVSGSLDAMSTQISGEMISGLQSLGADHEDCFSEAIEQLTSIQRALENEKYQIDHIAQSCTATAEAFNTAETNAIKKFSDMSDGQQEQLAIAGGMLGLSPEYLDGDFELSSYSNRDDFKANGSIDTSTQAKRSTTWGNTFDYDENGMVVATNAKLTKGSESAVAGDEDNNKGNDGNNNTPSGGDGGGNPIVGGGAAVGVGTVGSAIGSTASQVQPRIAATKTTTKEPTPTKTKTKTSTTTTATKTATKTESKTPTKTKTPSPTASPTPSVPPTQPPTPTPTTQTTPPSTNDQVTTGGREPGQTSMEPITNNTDTPQTPTEPVTNSGDVDVPDVDNPVDSGDYVNKIPEVSATTPTTSKGKSSSGSAVIPVIAGVSAAAAAGIGAKAYMDHRNNNENEEDEEMEEEWSDDNSYDIDYNNAGETSEELAEYNEAEPEKYGARNNEELADIE